MSKPVIDLFSAIDVFKIDLPQNHYNSFAIDISAHRGCV